MPKEAVEWYQGFLKKVTETPEWKKYMEEGALKPAFAIGPEYVRWVEDNEQLHKELMTKGGLLKKLGRARAMDACRASRRVTCARRT